MYLRLYGGMMNVLSLFSGIGGFDLGFERAGMNVVGMCEIDKHAQKILQRHFPDATLHTDVREVHYERGAVDLICGGFPCQDLSVAGKRRGLAGERSGLWYEFARIIDKTQPSWVVIENVPGLFSSNAGRDFAVIIDWLAQRGYGVGWRVLDAQGFGLAQRRKRVFIVGSFGRPRGCTVLLESESVRRDSTASRKAGQGDTRTTEDCTDENIAHRSVDVASALTAVGRRPEIGGNFVWSIQGNIIDRQRGGANGIGVATNTTMYTLTSTDRHAVAWHGTTALSPTLRAEAKQSLMTGDGNINAALAIAINGQHGQWSELYEQSHTLSTTRVEQVLWEAKGFDSCRIAADQECAPTLSARMGTGGNNTPLIGVRRLTPTECERLQGFPDGWTAGQADSNRYKQLGNAVAVPVAEWIGRRIMGVQ